MNKLEGKVSTYCHYDFYRPGKLQHLKKIHKQTKEMQSGSDSKQSANSVERLWRQYLILKCIFS